MTERAHPEAGLEFAIFGSCVTRDPFQFAEGVSVPLYCARQSIASSASPRASAAFLSQVRFTQGIEAFHQRSIESDIGKTALGKLRKLPAEIPVLIDLIEERVPLGVTSEDTIVTLSEAAQKFSNLPELVVRQIAPWGDEHGALFETALPALGTALEGKTVLIHRAFYAENRGDFPGINARLRSMYDAVQEAVPGAQVIEVAPKMLLSEPNHKWGYAPFHYIDDYYTEILNQIESLIGESIPRKSGFSLLRCDAETN